MGKIRVFTSFDFDHDEDLRNLLVGQAKHPDSPFELSDWSIYDHMAGNWRDQVRARIRRVDQVLVICGTHTDSASGVSAELSIAREEDKPYFLLQGRAEKTCVKPNSALQTDRMYKWTWENLKNLLAGGR